jgi:hypothetical protein
MKKFFFLFITGIVFLSCNNSGNSTGQDEAPGATVATAADSAAATASINVLTEQEKTEGWKLLFDGATKNGWHVYNKKSDGSAWKVADGALYLDTLQKKDWQTVGGGDLTTDEEFENFHLKLEWKLSPGGNSGIMFYINEDAKYEHAWHTGPEMQVLDNAAHPDAKIIKHRSGDLYDLITSTPETVNPAGEWNEAEIIANKGSLELRQNGTKVVSTTLWDDNWKKMVKESKFKTWKDFGTYKKGRIAIQDHGNMVWYRNIKIKSL